jgi:hypothetical protein
MSRFWPDCDQNGSSCRAGADKGLGGRGGKRQNVECNSWRCYSYIVPAETNLGSRRLMPRDLLIYKNRQSTLDRKFYLKASPAASPPIPSHPIATYPKWTLKNQHVKI